MAVTISLEPNLNSSAMSFMQIMDTQTECTPPNKHGQLLSTKGYKSGSANIFPCSTFLAFHPELPEQVHLKRHCIVPLANNEKEAVSLLAVAPTRQPRNLRAIISCKVRDIFARTNKMCRHRQGGVFHELWLNQSLF